MGLNVGDNVFSTLRNTWGELLEFIDAGSNSDGEKMAMVMWIEGDWSIEYLDEIDPKFGPLTRAETLASCLIFD